MNTMQKYYSNLVVLEDNHNEGVFCTGRGWAISFESNPSSHIVTGNEPAKEIVVYTQSADRAQHVIDLVFVCIIIDSPKIKVKIDPPKCVWLDRDKIETLAGNICDIKIVKDYYLWRIQKSTFWSTKI